MGGIAEKDRGAPQPALRAGGTRSFGRRVEAIEWLDDPQVDPDELRRNLADLARLNRLPGGAHASVRAIRRLAPFATSLDVLDAGAGGGDIGLRFAARGWRVTAVDNHQGVLEHLRHASARHPAIRAVEGDARRLPFRDTAFDVAHSSLLLHHLEPPDAIAALREMARVSRHGVVVNDLRRGPLSFILGAPTVLAFGRSRITRHDGLISLRRAYTLPELDQMLEAAGLRVVWRSSSWMPRVVTAATRSHQ